MVAAPVCVVMCLGALVSCGFFVDSWDPLRAAEPATEAAADQAVVHAPGSLDTDFLAIGAGANGYVRWIAVQSDGKILIGGDFTTYNGTPRGHVARLNADGSLDTTFLASGVGANYGVVSIAVQSNGQILIGGSFSSYNGTPRGHVARLNADGSLDTGFLASGTGASSYVYSIAVQSGAKVLVFGDFTDFNGNPLFSIARLGADGSLDTGFPVAAAGPDTFVLSNAIQNDGQILIGGNFTNFGTSSRGHIARMNPDGGLDPSFLATGNGTDGKVYAIAIQSSGKILVGGNFTTYNSTSRKGLARVNVDGSLDTSFPASGTGANDALISTVLQSDRKILVGGNFTTYNGTSRGHIARLNANGSLDTGFLAAGAAANGDVYAIAVQSNGQILIGGDFTTYNGVSRGHIARVWN